MKKIILIAVVLCIAGCAPKKPELAPTQIVNGKSIIVPPDFDKMPR